MATFLGQFCELFIDIDEQKAERSLLGTLEPVATHEDYMNRNFDELEKMLDAGELVAGSYVHRLARAIKAARAGR